MHHSFQWGKLVCAILLAQTAGIVGSFATTPNLDWYTALLKPTLNPPGWVFGPVWTLLYTMIGIAFFLVWKTHTGGRKRTWWLRLFLVHLVINALWSIVFFGSQSLLGGLVVISILWMMIATLILIALHFSRPASLLLIPYLAWVSFASYLNLSLWTLNG